MSISLTDFVDSVAGERIAELEEELKWLRGLMPHVYESGYLEGCHGGKYDSKDWAEYEGSILKEADIEMRKAKGESDGRS